MTTTDETALLAAIHANPDDDGPRLAYADYLDETHGGVACPECPDDEGDEPHPADIPCQRCHGARFVPHPRAEFIRVQCEMSSSECAALSRFQVHAPSQAYGPCRGCERARVLRKRETELRTAHEADWRRAGPCPKCEGKGWTVWGRTTKGQPLTGQPQCQACHGTGDRGGLLQRKWLAELRQERFGTTPWHHPVQFRRGFLEVVSAEMGQVFERRGGFDRRGPDCGVDWSGRNGFPCTCSWASGLHGDVCPEHGKAGVAIPEWRPTQWALAVAREHRTVRELRLTDRVPARGSGGIAEWYKDAGRNRCPDETPYHLLDVVFDALEGGSLHPNGEQGGAKLEFRVYPTAEEANAALGRAVIAVLRGWKG